VIVVGRERGPDAVALEQPRRDARVLAGDEIGRRERRERAQRHVTQVADRRRYQVEPGRERPRGKFVALDTVNLGSA
jgi:hypothetical protein